MREEREVGVIHNSDSRERKRKGERGRERERERERTADFMKSKIGTMV